VLHDWATAASLMTAGGTLALAIATFVSVRSSNRAARLAEYSIQVGIRPLLMPSRLEDPAQKVTWGDDHWTYLPGSSAGVELEDGIAYLSISLRNAGGGTAVIHGWHLRLEDRNVDHPHAEPEQFRRQFRDLYIPNGDIGFWQGAVRDASDSEYHAVVDAITNRERFGVELLYSDHEGGQRTIGGFGFIPRDDDKWLCTVVRHWNVDRPDPR